MENFDYKYHSVLKKIAKRKRLFDIWGFFDRRKGNFLNQKIRIFRVFGQFDFFVGVN